MSEKAKFLMEYMKNTKTAEDIDIEEAWSNLSCFYENLPERTKGKERHDEYSYLIQAFAVAHDKIIEKLANCPFVKIEITDQLIKQDLESLKEKVETIYQSVFIQKGWNCADRDINEERYLILKHLIENRNSKNYDDFIRKTPIEIEQAKKQ